MRDRTRAFSEFKNPRCQSIKPGAAKGSAGDQGFPPYPAKRARKPAPDAGLDRGEWMGGVTHGLRRLSKATHKAPAHPLSVAKAGFLGDPLDRQPSLLEQITGGLKP